MSLHPGVQAAIDSTAGQSAIKAMSDKSGFSVQVVTESIEISEHILAEFNDLYVIHRCKELLSFS